MPDVIVSKKAFDGDMSTMSGMKSLETEAVSKTPNSANDDEGDTTNEGNAHAPLESSAPMENLGGEIQSSPEMKVPLAGTTKESTSSGVGPYLMTLLYASIFLGALFATIWFVRRWALKEDEEESNTMSKFD